MVTFSEKMAAIKEQEAVIGTLLNWALGVWGRSNQTNVEVTCFLEELIKYFDVVTLFFRLEKSISLA